MDRREQNLRQAEGPFMNFKKELEDKEAFLKDKEEDLCTREEEFLARMDAADQEAQDLVEAKRSELHTVMEQRTTLETRYSSSHSLHPESGFPERGNSLEHPKPDWRTSFSKI